MIQTAPVSSMQTVTVMICSLFPTCCAHGLPMMASEALTSPFVAVVRVYGDGSPYVQALAKRAYVGIEAYHKARTIAIGVIACALAVR